MKRRRICQAALGMVLIIYLMYHLGGSLAFPVLKDAEFEKQFSEGMYVKICGEVCEKTWSEDSWILSLKKLKVKGDQKSNFAAEEKLLIYLSDEFEGVVPEYGEYIQVYGKVNSFQEAPNPGNFNQRFYYQKQGICGALKEAQVECVYQSQNETRWRNRILEGICGLKQKVSIHILSYLGEEKGGVLCAILLGENQLTVREIKELYRKSGIGHLLAISGLHVSFVGMGVYEALRRLLNGRALPAFVSGMVLVLYAVMAGGSVSAIRAVTMFLFRMGAEVTGREYDGLTALGSAAILVLLEKPLMLFDAGFLLSFGAVLVIYVIFPRLKSKEDMKIILSVKMSLSVQMAVLPVMLYYYYEISLYSLLWNLIAVPLSGIVLTSGFAGTLSGMILTGKGMLLTKIFYGICGVILEIYEKGSTWILELPGARWVSGQPGIPKILIYYLLLLVAFQFMRKKIRAVTAGIILAAVMILGIPVQSRGQIEIFMINVGQGDCFLVRHPNGETSLIDAGSSTVSNVGQYRIEPFLKSQGVGKLDYVWISHGDIDHVGGIEEMLMRQKQGIRIKSLVMPEKMFWDEKLHEVARTAYENGTKIYEVKAGQILKEGDMKVMCIWPEIQADKTEKTEIETGNGSSMVLAFTYKEFDMLFTGDLENEEEETVVCHIEKLQNRGILSENFEVLKVGHHGSKNATSEHLLQVLDADAAFVSAGEGNRYGHPHEEVLERLAKWHVSLYNTKDGHAVKICTDGEKYSILGL